MRPPGKVRRPAAPAPEAKSPVRAKAAKAGKADQVAKSAKAAKAAEATGTTAAPESVAGPDLAPAAPLAPSAPSAPDAQEAPARPPRAPARKRRRPVPAPGFAPSAAAAAVTEVDAPVPLAPVPPPPLSVDALDGKAVFGRHAVRLPDDEPAEVTLRATLPGSAWCSCLDFALSEDASCPHVEAVLTQVQGHPGWMAGPGLAYSRVVLQQGARARPLWLAGTECPPALDERATALLAADPLDDAALPRLLRAARDAAHWVQVDEAVWQQLAASRDARWRMQRLEQLLPEGPASAELQRLVAEPLLPLQAEGALFALCAGRSVLADCVELQPPLQALAAMRLARRCLGIERMLVLAPAAALDGWRRALGQDLAGDGDLSLMSIEGLAADAALHQGLEPELVVVHEPPGGGLWVDPERAAALLRLRSPMALVLPPADALQQAAEWPLRIAYVDADRLGAYAALLQGHAERDHAARLCGLQRLDGLRETLATVLLARPFDEVRTRLPERVDHSRVVPLPASARAAATALTAPLRATLEHWRALGWLPDGAQRRLLGQLQGLRRWCAGEGAPDVAAAKAEALRSLLSDRGWPRVAAFSQWPAALQAVADHLGELQPALWSPDQPAAQRDAARQRFCTDPGCRLLLLADAGATPLDLGLPGLPVVHLDRPWNPRALSRRFGRVHRRGQAHLVPVVHLVLGDSLEQRLADTAAERGDAVTDLPDAQPGDGFLQGEALQAFGDDLARLLQLAPAHAAPEPLEP